MKYLLMNIGCIECGVSSQIVGIFCEKKQAEDLAEILSDKGYWREMGQNAYEVFEMEDGPWVKEEYLQIAKHGLSQ
jgi:hypothetical protein